MDIVVPKTREEILNAARGISGECYPFSAATGNATFSSQDVRATLCPFRRGDLVTNLLSAVDTAGTSMTHAQMILCDSSGNILAQTGDSSADRTALQTAQAVAMALSSPYTILADGGYYIALWLVSTGSAPKMKSANNTASAEVSGFGSGLALTALMTAQASLPASLSLATKAGPVPWYGWS